MERIGPKDDDKLISLKRYLAKLPKNEKVLIFSEAETTVEYLYNQLNPGGRDTAIARLSGSNRVTHGDGSANRCLGHPSAS